MTWLEGVVSPAGCIELQVAHCLVRIALFLSLLRTNIKFPDLMKFSSDFVYNLDAWKDLMSAVHHSPCFVPSTQCLRFIIALALFLLSSLKSIGDRSFSFITPTVSGIRCLPAVESPHFLRLQIPAESFPFSTGISTNLGKPWLCVCVCVFCFFFVCVCVCVCVDYVYVCVYIFINAVCWLIEFF